MIYNTREWFGCGTSNGFKHSESASLELFYLAVFWYLLIYCDLCVSLYSLDLTRSIIAEIHVCNPKIKIITCIFFTFSVIKYITFSPCDFLFDTFFNWCFDVNYKDLYTFAFTKNMIITDSFSLWNLFPTFDKTLLKLWLWLYFLPIIFWSQNTGTLEYVNTKVPCKIDSLQRYW